MRIDDRVCAIAVVMAGLTLLYGGLIGHFAPAPTPHDSVQDVARFFHFHNRKILLFAFCNCIATALLLPAFAALSAAMWRMQPRSTTLTFVQITGGIFASVGPFLGSMFLAAAVVRPDASPEVIASLTDLAVLFIELSTLPALFQGLSLYAATFRDQSSVPILPRWFGVVSLVWGILAQGGMPAVFVESGPFSANGLVGIVLPMVSLFVWMAATAFVLFRIRPYETK